MTAAIPIQLISGRKATRLTHKIIIIALLAFGFGSIIPMFWGAHAHAQVVDPCLQGLPTPTPQQPAVHRVLQLINCSNQVVLGAANAAGKAGVVPLKSVFPREKTWVMQPYPPSTPNGNILTIDVPPKWESTIGPGSTGPRIWARTGCRYDIASDRAQCETGGCGGKYDCSAAKLGASVGTTVAEWTFYEQVTAGNITYFKDSPDISAVDGVNLNMDIQPVGGHSVDPFDALGGHDIQWLAQNYPLTKHGQDMRSDARCLEKFRLQRSDLTSGIYAFVIVGNDGKPLGGDGTVACFSNCARYAFPDVPAADCDSSDHNTRCYRWKSFCLNEYPVGSVFGVKCTQDSDCKQGTSCWNNPGSKLDHTCQGRAFIKNATCPSNICTFPYGYIDPTNGQQFFSTQPPFGHCSDIVGDNPKGCIGDDVVHHVMHKAYTWPNDPQVYGGDAQLYRIIFAPGGTTVPITPAGAIPVCSDLPTIYGYSTQYGGPGSNSKPCDVPVNIDKATFAVAHPSPTGASPWACNLSPGGAGNEGVICRWATP
ncbi:Thaumatin pathogenesis-related protein [Methylocella tundrae]|uniref:Thaumatin pathogenesis-related protein n=1 Tax=Methylocella tundrae TaxID=227605 RepID=A0A8B6M7K0_METTU|nr:thaumatin family protein [Methylocella tundrae]VTZ50389.1 Thaumatin pathogenesis-related protein [Methylocella tundrae]